MSITPAALELKGISKSFAGQSVLTNITFQLNSSEIVALLGDNGAGKSTLIQILSGLLMPDQGEIHRSGKPISIQNPKDSEKNGIVALHQNFQLVDVYDVATNIYLGHEPTRLGFILDRKTMEDRSNQILRKFDFDISSIKKKVKDLSGGQKQLIAIAQALAKGGEILLFDEPSAALGVKQNSKLNSYIKILKQDGKSILLVSHNLQQTFDVADRLLILRQGEIFLDCPKNEVSLREVTELILAR
jgi:ABC-type sugar transport system ATPase subunit